MVPNLKSQISNLRVSTAGAPVRNPSRARARAGFTILEMMIVFLILAILASFAVPIVRRSVEKALVDDAAANLKGLWTAQRLYWLKYGVYATTIQSLQQEHFFVAQGSMYSSGYLAFVYSVAGAESNACVMLATPQDTGRWSGGLRIANDGFVTGSIQANDGRILQPSGESGKP